MRFKFEYFRPTRILTQDDIYSLVSADADKSYYLNAEKLISEEQVIIALEEAFRLINREIRVRQPGTLFMMLLSGKRQIKQAVASVGLTPDTEHILRVSVDGSEKANSGILEKENFKLPGTASERDREVFYNLSSGEFFAFQ